MESKTEMKCWEIMVSLTSPLFPIPKLGAGEARRPRSTPPFLQRNLGTLQPRHCRCPRGSGAGASAPSPPQPWKLGESCCSMRRGKPNEVHVNENKPFLPAAETEKSLFPFSAQQPGVPSPRRVEGSVGTPVSPSCPTKAGGDSAVPGPIPHGQSTSRCHQQYNSIMLSSSSDSPFDAVSPAEPAHALVCPSTLLQVI